MPVISPGFGVSATDTQGMTRSQIIEMADKRTGRIGRELNLNAEYHAALQSFCLEHWWWWRKKMVYWRTQESIGQYDLAELNGPAYELDVYKVTKFLLYDSAGCKLELSPIFDETTQIDLMMVEGTGLPSSYFMIAGTMNQICIWPTPVAIYNAWFSFWAMPNRTVDQLTDKVPLVPGYLHHFIVEGLECNILAAIKGRSSKDYIAARTEYKMAVEEANQAKNFADGDVSSWASTSEAIRSTR